MLNLNSISVSHSIICNIYAKAKKPLDQKKKRIVIRDTESISTTAALYTELAVIADVTLVNIQMCHVQGGKMPRGPALLNMETLLCAVVALSLIANDLIIPSA